MAIRVAFSELHATSEYATGDKSDAKTGLLLAIAAAVDSGGGVLLSPGIYDADIDVDFEVPMVPMPGALLKPQTGRLIEIPAFVYMPGHFQWIDESDGGNVSLPAGEVSPAWFGESRDVLIPTMGIYAEGCYYHHVAAGLVGPKGRMYTTDENGNNLEWREWGLVDSV